MIISQYVTNQPLVRPTGRNLQRLGPGATGPVKHVVAIGHPDYWNFFGSGWVY